MVLDQLWHLVRYQMMSRPALPYKPSSNNRRVAFLQRGGQGGGRGGCGAQGKSGEKVEGNRADTGGNNDVSTVTARTGTGDGAVRTNSKREFHCFHCRGIDPWAFECPQLSKEQQAQLHMNIRSQEEREQEQTKEGHQLLNMTLAQAGELPDNWAYLDGCSMVTAFKTDRYLREIETVPRGIKINCNAEAVMTNKRGKYRGLNVWYIPDGIANIFSMHELEKMYPITYNSWVWYYKVHTPKGRVQFHKDEQGLPFIDLESSRGAAIMLLLQEQEAEETVETIDRTLRVQTVQENFKGYTKREILQAKEARQAQAMIGSPSEKDYKGMVGSNIIKNCPITVSNVTNA